MRIRRENVIAAAIAVSAIIGFAPMASAACSLPGAWRMLASYDSSSFVGVVACKINIAVSGKFTGTCQAYNVGQAGVSAGSVAGTFSLNAQCDLSGSFTPAGFPVNTIKAGHINGVSGAAIATRGGNTPTQVRMITLVKQ